MKIFILGLLIIQIGWVIFWQIGYSDLSDMPEISRQTYAIMANVKYIIAIALYIAWRVTPESR